MGRTLMGRTLMGRTLKQQQQPVADRALVGGLLFLEEGTDPFELLHEGVVVVVLGVDRGAPAGGGSREEADLGEFLVGCPVEFGGAPVERLAVRALQGGWPRRPAP